MSGVDTINTVILVARKHDLEFQKNVKASDPKTWIEDDDLYINFSSVNNIGLEPSGKLIYANNNRTAYENSDLKVIADKISNNNYENIISDPFDYADLVHGSDRRRNRWRESNIRFLRKSY